MEIKDVVKEKYGQAALRVATGGSSCCGASARTTDGCDPITSNLYDAGQTDALPEEAVLASLGCGNPTALAQVRIPAKSCWISDRAAASTCCSPPGASVQPEKPTAWT